MLIKTFCLAMTGSLDAIRDIAARAVSELPGLRQAQVYRVLRHIPTDSIDDQNSHVGVVPVADEIETVLELYFDGQSTADIALVDPAWAVFISRLSAVTKLLFLLDSESNIPIEPRAGAIQGGFRRWMLLARKSKTQTEFRDAWFGRHADLVMQLPQVDGYLQNLVIARYDEAGQPLSYESLPIDGVAQLCFADESMMIASDTSDARLLLH